MLLIVVAVYKSLVSETTGFLITHPGSSFFTYGISYHQNQSRWTCSKYLYGIFPEIAMSYIWPGRWPSTRFIGISTMEALKTNLIQRLVD